MNDSEIIIDLLSQIQRGVSQDRNGDSYIVGPLYEKTLKKLEELKFVQQKKHADEVKNDSGMVNDLTRAAVEFRQKIEKGLLNAGKTQSEARAESKKSAQEYLKKLQEINEENKKNLLDFEDRFENTIEEWEKGLKQIAGRNVASSLSNGKSDRIHSQGKSIKGFGDSLSKLAGEKGVVGKLGKSFSGLGTAVMRVAGPLGIMAQGLKIAHDWWTKSVELEAKRYDLNAADIKQQHGIKQRQISGASQIASQNASVASATLSALSSAASSAQSAMGAFAQEAVGIHAELATEGKKIVYDAYATSHEVASSLPFDIKNGVYQAAEAAIDIGSRAQNYETSNKFADKALGIAAEKMENQISGAHGSAAAAIEGAQAVASINNAATREKTARDVQSMQLAQQSSRAEAKYAMESSRRDINFPILGKLANSLYYDVKQREKMAPMNYNRDVTTARNQTANAITDLKAQVASTNASLAAQAKQTNIQLATQTRDMNLSIQKQQQDMKKNIETAANEAAAKIQKAWLKMTEKLNDAFLKHQQASTVMGREMGMTGDKLAKYSDRMFAYQVEVSKWGKDLEWMQKAQGGYQESTGRNVEWSQNDYETSAGMGMLVGDDTIAEYISGMEIFNQSVEDSNEKLYTMFKDVSKIGLNGKKYAKELAGSLKLAEKYNFKEGTKSLREMVKWAQNMRFNMGSLDGMLDKVQEGGLEGVIKQSAELQVLGGNFAMGSDPLAMAYESYMDPEAYAKRMNSMIAGQGMFDSKTGEVSFGIASQQMMRQYANSTGQDYKDVLNQARAQVKMAQINGSFTDGQNFNEDQKMLIANKAQYDTETGKWKVQVGESKVDVGTLSDKDIEALTPSENVEQDMLTELQSLRSIQERYTADQMENMATLVNTKVPDLIDTNNKILAAVGEEFKNNFETYVKESTKGLRQLKEAPQSFLDMFKNGNEDVDAKRVALMNKIDDLIGTIKGADKSAEGHIAGAMSQSAPTMGVSTVSIGMPEIPSMNDEDYLKPEESKTFNWGLVGIGTGIGAGVGAAAGMGIGSIHGSVVGAGVGLVSGLTAATLEYCGVIDDAEESMSEFSSECENAWDDFSSWCGSAWNSVTNVASSAWDATTEWAGSAWESTKEFASSAWDGIKTLGEWVWKNIKEIGLNVWSNVKNTAINAWNNIKEFALSIWTLIKDTAVSMWNTVKDTAIGVWNSVKEFGLAIWTPIKETASGIWKGVKDTASGIWTDIKNVGLKMWEPLEKFGDSVWKGITDAFEGVANAASKLWGGIKGFADWIGNFVSVVQLGEITTFWEYGKNGFRPTAEMKREHPGMFHDGYISQNGKTVRIDDNDQVLAAKQGGPVDKMLNLITNTSQVTPLPKRYDSFVRESLYSDKSSSDGKIEIAPIQININGNIQLTGSNGTIDITQQISNDPNFIRALTQMISLEVEKKARGGRTNSLLNRNLEF